MASGEALQLPKGWPFRSSIPGARTSAQTAHIGSVPNADAIRRRFDAYGVRNESVTILGESNGIEWSLAARTHECESLIQLQLVTSGEFRASAGMHS